MNILPSSHQPLKTLHKYTITGHERTQQCSTTVQFEKLDEAPAVIISTSLPVAAGSGRCKSYARRGKKDKHEAYERMGIAGYVSTRHR